MLPTSLAPHMPSVTAEAFSPHGSSVRIAGELDLASAGQLGEVVEGEIAGGRHQLVIDLSAATFLDCASIATLLRAVTPLRYDPDATIVVAGATGVVRRLLDLVQLDRLFDAVPDVVTAIEHATDRHHVDGWRRVNRERLLADRPGGGRDRPHRPTACPC